MYFFLELRRKIHTIHRSHNKSDLCGICRTCEMCVDLLGFRLVQGNETVQYIVARSRIILTTYRKTNALVPPRLAGARVYEPS